jgi:hypothetical protein
MPEPTKEIMRRDARDGMFDAVHRNESDVSIPTQHHITSLPITSLIRQI